MNSIDSIPILSVRKVLQRTCAIFKAHMSLYIVLGLIYGIGGTLAERFASFFGKNELTAYFMLNIFIASWVIILLIQATALILKGKTPAFQEIVRGTQGVYMRYLTVYLSLFLLMAVGFVFLVLPGIYIATVFVFTDMLVVIERAKYMEAFSKSYDLVQGRFWKVLQFLGAIIMISLLPTLLSSAVSAGNVQMAQTINKIFAVFVMPFYIIAQVVFYSDVKAIAQASQER